MAQDRQTRQERLEKQRLRQQAHRARMKAERRPSFEDLSRALLDVALTRNLRRPDHKRSKGVPQEVASRLKEVGFHESDTEAAWLELQARYERGWSMLRQRRTIAEMEAEGLADEDA